MTWQEFEKNVRKVADYIWDSESIARKDTINGVSIDCLIEKKHDYWILIEITQEESLDKLRTDLAKFASVRPYLFSKSVYCECYFICENDPPPSLVETGKGQNVIVLSFSELKKLFVNFEKYSHLRAERKFGSAVDPFSGEKDNRPYVPVKYIGVNVDKEYSVNEIAQHLKDGRKFILLGNYGTGKSRCIQKLFSILTEYDKNSVFYPIAIDLRDNWGTRRGHELIQRHCDDLGLSSIVSSINKIIEKVSICLLLDGFDEIGSQSWSDNPSFLGEIRAKSLLGVKDLISRSKGGVIVTGREHYFNSNQEMYDCLGMNKNSTTVIKCADEFTDEEMQNYLEDISSSSKLPKWLPRRPLICQIIVDMDSDDLKELAKQESGGTVFWRLFIYALCEREARINRTLDATTIKKVLQRVARITRTKIGDVAPISISEINRAFEAVTGLLPVDESAIMLQRLPGLGRIGSESTDRHFVDRYILDGLRTDDTIDIVDINDQSVVNEKWINPLGLFGITLLSQEIETTSNKTAYLRIMKSSAIAQNKILAGDILSSILYSAEGTIDFSGLTIKDAHLVYLKFSHMFIKRLAIESSIINEIDISECQVDDVKIEDSLIDQVYGVSAAKGLPSWMSMNSVDKYQSVSTVARIRKIDLNLNQRIFITLIKKLFFQPGAGRKEEALLRGLGESADKKVADRIIKILMAEKIIDKFKGKEGWVYTPNRSHAKRMDNIINQLTLSNDPIWKRIS